MNRSEIEVKLKRIANRLFLIKQGKILYATVVALSFVLLTGFGMRGIDVAVRFVNIDSQCDILKLEFRMTCPRGCRAISLSQGDIHIFKNDSLYLKLVSNPTDSLIDFWMFPSIPDGYEIVYPESINSMPTIRKADRLRFVFRPASNYVGIWEYNPFYSNKKARWMFDEFGNQKITINVSYQPVIFRRDVIVVRKSEDFIVEKSNFQIFDDKDTPLEFEVRSRRRHQTNEIELRLRNHKPKGSRLKLSANFGKERYYEEMIIVPNRNSIRLH